MSSFRALHIGDLHFWRIPLNPLMYLKGRFLGFNKRMIGVGNLLIGGRGRRFRQQMAPQLVQRLIELKADAILFSGDFTSTSAPGEFAAAREIFGPVVEATPLGAYSVPGNHDCYLGSKIDAIHFKDRLGDSFRPVQELEYSLLGEQVALFQINATTPNGLGSHGRILSKHLEMMERLCSQLSSNVKAIWFLCHFPAEDPPGLIKHDRGNQLLHHGALLDFFRSVQLPVLWLHGHHHYRWVYGSPNVPNLVYLNAGAPFLRRGKVAPDLGFHELHYAEGQTSIISHQVSPATSGWETMAVAMPKPGQVIDLQGWKVPED